MKSYPFYTCIILLVLQSYRVTGQNIHNWIRTNPGAGGAFNVVKAGPTGTILVGSDLSGVYKSTDNGNTFTPLGAMNGLTFAHIGGIGFDPIDSNKFYIGTVNGLFNTTDGGTTFVKSIPNGYISDIVVSKSNPQYVYVAWHSNYNTTDAQIFRSTDGGISFAKISSLANGLRIIKLIADPTDYNTIYFITGNARSACSVARLYKSIDAGITFSDKSGGMGEILDMDLDPTSPNVIYMTTINAVCGSPYYYLDRTGKFYKSTNGGDSWTLQSNKTGAIFVKQDEPNKIRRIDPRNTANWNTESGTWESQNGGVSWYQIGNVVNGWDTGYQKDVAGGTYEDITQSYSQSFEGIIKGMGTDMSNPNVILWVGSQWAFRSTNGGVTFQNIFTNMITTGWWQSKGLDNINIVDMAISEANNDILYAGYFDIGFWRSLDGGLSWQSSNPLPYTGYWNGYGGNVASIVADPTRSNVVWTTMSGNQLGESPTYLIKSINTGERNSWVLSNSGLPTQEVMGLSIDRTSTIDNRTIYVTAQGFMYKSINDGSSWAKLTNGLPTNGGIRFTAVDNFDGNIVYAGGGNGLYASTDGGNSWSNIGNAEINSGGSVAFWPQTKGQGVFDIVPDPLISGMVYITVYGTNKGLYRGVKSGSGWTWSKLYTDSFMRKVSINRSNNNIIYATSSSAFTDGYYHPNSKGVIFSTDGFATYSIVNAMTWPFGMTVKTTPSMVYVGSPGTGIQKSSIPTVSTCGCK